MSKFYQQKSSIRSNSNEKYAIFTLVGYKGLSQVETNAKLANSITAINNSNGNHQFSLEEKTTDRDQYSFQNDKPMIIQSGMDQFKSKKSPLIVVAIDFGTTYTGYAFVFKNDKDQIHYMKKNYGLDNQNKVPTILLLDHRKQFHSFGYEAKNFFYNLDYKKSSKFYYFENFKMTLYQEKLLKKFKLNSLNHPDEMFDAIRIFTISLEHLCSQALKEIGEQCSITLTKDDIEWVITVPAIWSNSSKQFMRMAAEQTDKICNETLRIALEPEVASLYCRKYLSDEYRLKGKDKRYTTENDCLIVKSGTKYLIVDFGGGTVDITAHEDQSNGFIKEIHKSTGGPFGSNEINKQFEDIICSIFGAKLWTKFKKQLPSTYLDLMQTFEIRKQEARPDRNTAYNILLTYSFINFFKPSIIEDLFDRKAPNGLAFSSKLGIIRIDAPLMHKLFHKVIEPTIKIIQSLLDGHLKSHQIKHIFLVGGFAQSLVLKQAFRSVFEPKFNVIIPNQAQLAVLYGACQYGLNPTLIQSRRVMKTYGIAVLVKFDPAIHPEEKRITKDGLHWCSDVFDRFVTINQSIGIFESIKRKYKPIFSTQTSCIFQIYCTESAEVRFVTDPGVIKCGTLYLELDQIQFPDNVNPAIKQLFQREIEVEMFFGETEIKFSAKDLRTGYMVKNVVDFLSKIE